MFFQIRVDFRVNLILGFSSPLTTSLPDIDTTTRGDNHHIITTALQDGHSRVKNEIRKNPEKDILEKPLSKTDILEKHTSTKHYIKSSTMFSRLKNLKNSTCLLPLEESIHKDLSLHATQAMFLKNKIEIVCAKAIHFFTDL